MKDEIKEHIRSLSNTELIEYINAPPDTYLPEAIAFAREEAEKRQISTNDLQRAEEEIADRESAKEEVENAPLEPIWRFILFILPISIIFVIPVWLRFRQDGALRKIRQLWGYWFAGVALWIIILSIKDHLIR